MIGVATQVKQALADLDLAGIALRAALEGSSPQQLRNAQRWLSHAVETLQRLIENG